MVKRPRKHNRAERRIQDAIRSNATKLDLSELGLTTLPKSIGQLTQLQRLFVSHNQLSMLPEAIGQLTQLRNLDISQNQLSTLPEAIGQLTQLRNLDVSQNQLSTLPEAIGQLTRLESLILIDNELTMLPEVIGKLTRLLNLILSSNQLTTLPEAIGQLTQLRGLSVSHNQLSTLPESIGQLTQLQNLDVSWNQLTTMPEMIGLLNQFQGLNLIMNQLTTLPKAIRQLDKLEYLFLHNNEALGLPLEVLGPQPGITYLTPTLSFSIEGKHEPTKPQNILEYYFRTRAERQPLNEAKLILVGHGAVGKTSLVNRLVHNSFDRKEKKTEGIQITQWPIYLHDNEDVRLHIWDFGGQEIMHSTHQFFLTQRSLYLLVLNGRQGHEDSDAEYWLNLIKSFGEDSPVIVVLNKIKEHPFDVNRRGLMQKFPAVRNFVATDCEAPIGIDELRQVIERETDRLKHLRDAFPASWFTIKDRLAGMAENYLAFDRYREICKENGETDPQAQESLAFYLHSLGIALNYKDDPRLRDTHVLNPHWVTNGIYTILNAQNLALRQGELRVTDLTNILDLVEYPPERHNFLLELMRKFELCFGFPEEDTRYLIPELLDKQQPAQAAEFKPGECLNFQYYYPILPEGTLPRFIVRTHVLSARQPRWRTGVILEFEGNYALVLADVQDKRVIIAVAGPASGRRRLLAVIRSDFEHIHRSFKFQPQEMIPVPDHPEVLVLYQELLVMERNGLKTFPKVIGTEVLELDIQELLNGVDLEGMRKAAPATESPRRALRLFYSYSHKDEELHNELETHLKLLQRQGLIEPWHDRRITAGEDWKGQIDENLERADIILLLVSADFIASDYCYDTELKRALERHEASDVRVIPVIVRDVNWQMAPFAMLQSLPKNGKAVMLWPNKDSAWRNVAEGIEKAIEKILARRENNSNLSSKF